MKHAFGALCVAAGLSAFLNAQTQDPPSKPAQESKPVTVTGCLQEEAAGRYSLTEEPTAATAPGKTYRLSESSGVDLKAHVGRKVQVTGMKAGKEPTGKVVDNPDPSMLKVTSVKQVSETCSSVK